MWQYGGCCPFEVLWKVTIKVLNLYAGIGGNRKLWENVEVVAVENIKSIANAYKTFFPNDTMVVGDAKQYLLDNLHRDWDFIWASPPCPTHSRLGFMAMKNRIEYRRGNRVKEHSKELSYPNMGLYQLIIVLKHLFGAKWVVENPMSYYEPLIKPQICGRHWFWSNFPIPKMRDIGKGAVSVNTLEEKQKMLGFDLSGFDFSDMEGHRKDKILNNCVDPRVGLYVFSCAFKDRQTVLGGVI